jgi:hypothetical protein
VATTFFEMKCSWVVVSYVFNPDERSWEEQEQPDCGDEDGTALSCTELRAMKLRQTSMFRRNFRRNRQ